jgi:phenylacetic acid degradation operon negative regulatory protein
MPEGPLRRRTGNSAKSLLLTVLGEFVLPRGGTIWTATIVDALGLLGVEERNARQAVARLKDQGLVDVERHGRRARWCLTADGRHLLTVGTERIYRFGADREEWDGRWVVVLAGIPEEQRAKRHRLRSQLTFAGFGLIGPGTAVSPHPEREKTAIDIVRDLDLAESTIVLIARSSELAGGDDALLRAWDLDALAHRYETFVATFEGRRHRTPEARFTALVELVHAWRQFPFGDPEIPSRLLPAGWPGRTAKQLFDALHAAWAPDANLWYETAEAAAAR